ncbi:FAD dependent oxidoreductase [Jimgerdemannia flammicorona]|uniref:FAD dependent oxidoreductase n=1 Tax=Jimgerdemannia flammicorona TaxID=994334 RepID=A0A433QQV7_9FUNG|nr:FAD dependent oxidoreductase [Jimgerdemannia flammicorona]
MLPPPRCDGTPTEEISRKSFQLHADLARELNGPTSYDYRCLDTLAVTASTRPSSSPANVGPKLDWLDPEIILQTSVSGDKTTTAQLHPLKFTNTLMQLAIARGAELMITTVDGFEFHDNDDRRQVRGVRVTGQTCNTEFIPCDDVIIAMGPWSGLTSSWLPHRVAVSGSRVHSVILKPTAPVSVHALFVLFDDGKKESEPEVYPRPDGTVFVCGGLETHSLPADPRHIKPVKDSILHLRDIAGILSPKHLRDATVVREQCGFVPVSYDSIPLIGKYPGIDRLYMATGHSVWGILQAPATGLAMAELLLEGNSTSLDLKQFEPSRLLM